jgi:hypothetical protein
VSPYQSLVDTGWSLCLGPKFLTARLDEGRRHVAWRPTRPGEKEVIVITEPNISFQKSAIILFALSLIDGIAKK